MTVLPITPNADQIDPTSLTYICLVDRVSVSSFDQGILTHIGDGHLTAYISSDPSAEQQVLLLKFYDYYDQEKAAIVLVSRSKAWLQDERTLIFPRVEGGLWRVNCSDSEELTFTELQDVLTYFIKYENRHQMKNTLAMVNPVSCQVTQVVADNVQLDRTESESILDEEDFISSHEDEKGQKLPVYINKSSSQEPLDPSKVRKVRLLYQSGNAMVTGSDWIAHALVLTGQALAQGIASGGKMLEDKIEPNKEPIKLSQQERRVFEVAYNTTTTATNMAAGLVDMAVSTAVSKINELVYDDQQMQAREPVENASRHFGISALQAAVKIVGGVASAASMVLVSSRDSIIQMIHKKYGTDAGYMAEKTIGSGANMAEMLVYFDARGISRRVIVGGATEYDKQHKASQVFSTGTAAAASSNSSTTTTTPKALTNSKEKDGNQVVFENEWLDDDDDVSLKDASSSVQQDISASDKTTKKKADSNLIII
ncbi:senescence-associated protein-domain-containing protein [Mucor lusitanicus]|uniref:Senescence-associated protein-domain-containing protein n=1 Tax=Mucor circinelloides f. lusitanicus TaxID=29924 RepID=A0A8H4F574_MUCCL|nr:senescence-associated protein-domain-containing protein [Mucor lusitanicus]